MKPVELYLARDLNELKQKAESKGLKGPKKAKILVNSADKVWKMSQEAEEKGDQEQAYVMYNRFFEIYLKLVKTPEYKEDKKFHDIQIPPSRSKQAMAHLEILNFELEERYKERKEKLDLEDKQKYQAKIEADKLAAERHAAEETKRARDGNVIHLEAKELYNLMQERSTSFLILDVRPESDFRDSQIRTGNCLNIAPKMLIDGIQAAGVERSLNIQNKADWKRRLTADKVILMDWHTKSLAVETTPSDHPLCVLRDAMYQYDHTNKYACSRPYLLKGGFEKFLEAYSNMVTDAGKARKLIPLRCPGHEKVVYPTLNVKETRNKINFDIDPSFLDKGFIKTPSPSIADSGEETNSQKNVLFNSQNNFNSLNNNRIVNGGNFTDVGYSSDETEDDSDDDQGYRNTLGSPAISSGAVKMIKDSSSRPSAPLAVPMIPDRKSKPAVLMMTDNSSTVSNLLPEMSKLSLNDGYIKGVRFEKQRPSVPDRGLKARLLVDQTRGVDGFTSNQLHNTTIDDVLDAQKDLLEGDIEREEQENTVEDEWEEIRRRKEAEADSEMKAHLQANEDRLLDQMEQIRSQNEESNKENEMLRAQLQEMQIKLEAADKSAEESFRKKREMERREQELIAIREDVDRKRRERRRKEKELLEREKQARLKEDQEKNARLQYEIEERERNLRLAANNERNNTLTRAPLKQYDGGSSKMGLSRASSSPNIAKLLEDEDAMRAAPMFNRTSKPQAKSSKSIEGVWTTDPKKGITGLKNLGNTCYMNSVLQCLSNFRCMGQYFLNVKGTTGPLYERDLNPKSETRGEIAREFSRVLGGLWSGQFKSIIPSDLKSAIGRHNEAFRDYSQQDAHEFLMFFQGALHSDVNAVRSKVKLPELNYERMTEEEAINRSWEQQLQAERSFIRESMYGQRRSTLRCQSCGHSSVTYEAFFELSLQLPNGDGRCSLRECIKDLLKTEKVTWTCPKCKRDVVASKRLEIVKFPLILTVHLSRFFQEDNGMWRKKQNMVDFEMTDFKIGDFCTVQNGSHNRHKYYQLYGVCNHFGTMEGGHYTAYCFSQVYDKWYKYDDSDVTSMSAGSVRTKSAYMLFYSGIKN